MSIQRVLVVDDDSLSREFLTEAVRSFGFTAESAGSGHEALERLRRGGVDLVLTDMRMPGMDGVELVGNVSRDHPDVPVVLVTAHGTVETAVEAMRLGAQDFIMKPCTPETIELVIRRIDRTRRLERRTKLCQVARAGGAQCDSGQYSLHVANRLERLADALEITAAHERIDRMVT